MRSTSLALSLLLFALLPACGQKIEKKIETPIAAESQPTGAGAGPSAPAKAASDKPDGPWVGRDANGRVVEEGSYEDGLKTGVWQTFHPNGVPSTRVTFVNGQQTGPCRQWGENGVLLAEGNSLDGERDGVWIDYHPNGMKKREATWRKNKIEGVARDWRDDGSKMAETTYVGGVEHGPYWSFSVENKPELEYTYVNGKLEGIARKRYPDGSIAFEVPYVNGMREGEWISYFENGQMASKGVFSKDQRIGTWKTWKASGELDLVKSGVYEGPKKISDLPEEKK